MAEETTGSLITPQWANIYVKNNSGGNAAIQLTHQYSTNSPETGAWQAAPGQTVGPLLVHYATGFGSLGDYWWIRIQVKDGPNPGNYINTGLSAYPGMKECSMTPADAGQNLTFLVDTKLFNLNMAPPSCVDTMTRRSQYSPITNVFVLMLENHSFDHLLGFSKIQGHAYFHGATGPGGPIGASGATGPWMFIDGLSGNEFNTYGPTAYHVNKYVVDPMTTDPGHEFLDTLEQLCGTAVVGPTGATAVYNPGPYPHMDNSGFVANYATTTSEGTGLPQSAHYGDVLSCVGPTATQVNTLRQLARQYVVCDHWFSSIPGPTWPNRFFAMGASSGGLDVTPGRSSVLGWEVRGFGFQYPNGSSLFGLLRSKKLDFRVYFDTNGTWLGSVPMASALADVNTAPTSYGDLYRVNRLASDLQAPYPVELTWIEPNYGNLTTNFVGGTSQHPMDSLVPGDALTATVYNAIRNSPLWATSMLIVTYDEHGGFFDHRNYKDPVFNNSGLNIPPPGDTNIPGLNKHKYVFNSLGVRVPAVVVTPQTPGNMINKRFYDHTAIAKTVETLFGLKNLTNRDAWSSSLTDMLVPGLNRQDCLGAVDVPHYESFAEIEPEELAIQDAMPLPDTGNIWGFIFIAAKTEKELSNGTPAEIEYINQKVNSLKTKGDARLYLGSVQVKLEVARAALLAH